MIKIEVRNTFQAEIKIIFRQKMEITQVEMNPSNYTFPTLIGSNN
jgi:hypothetical protein